MLGWNFLFKLLKWLSIIAVIGIVIYFIYKIYKGYNKLDSKNKKKKHEINSLQKQLRSKKRDNRELRKQFNKQKEKINDLQTQLKSARSEHNPNEEPFNSSSIRSNSEVNELKDNNDSEKKIKSKQTLFFTVPNSDGEFNNKMGSSDSEGRNYYKITLEKGSKEGKIEFRSGELDASALDHRDSILRPVCEIKNLTASNPSRIQNIAPGKVKRVGDKWVIQEKIKIKFQ